MADPTPTPEPTPAPAPTPGEALYTPPVPNPEPVAPGDPPGDPVAPRSEPGDPVEPPAPQPAPADPPTPPVAPTPDAPIDAATWTPTLPENFTVDETALTAFKAQAAEAKLSPAAAQALMDTYISAQTAQANANAEAFNATQTAWTTEVNAMPEFAPSTREATQAMLGRTFDTYGTPEARQILDATGAGNNPALVRMFLNMAKALSEGGPTPPGGPPAARKPTSLGESFYGSTPQT